MIIHRKWDSFEGNLTQDLRSKQIDENNITLMESLFCERVGSTIMISGKLISAFFFSFLKRSE
jgi:hypothetical protein